MYGEGSGSRGDGGMAGRWVLLRGVVHRGAYSGGDSGHHTSEDDYRADNGVTRGGGCGGENVGRRGVTYSMLVTLLTSH